MKIVLSLFCFMSFYTFAGVDNIYPGDKDQTHFIKIDHKEIPNGTIVKFSYCSLKNKKDCKAIGSAKGYTLKSLVLLSEKEKSYETTVTSVTIMLAGAMAPVSAAAISSGPLAPVVFITGLAVALGGFSVYEIGKVKPYSRKVFEGVDVTLNRFRSIEEFKKELEIQLESVDTVQ